jgi:hypothetical protein
MDSKPTPSLHALLEKMEQALDTIKYAIIHGELKLHAPDYHYPLILETDGSDYGWGAVLLQNIKADATPYACGPNNGQATSGLNPLTTARRKPG